MEIKEKPFSVYDFLGYLIPGYLLHYGYLLLFNNPLCELNKITENINNGNEILYYIQLLIVFYISGHIVSYLSSATIEKYLFKIFGSPADNFIGYTNKNRCICLIDIIVIVFLLPISAIDCVRKFIFSINKPHSNHLDETLQKCAKKKLKDFLISEINLCDPKIINNIDGVVHPNINYFSSAYYYVIENYPEHLQRINNYVALYGFLRSVTFVLVLFSWSFLINSRIFYEVSTINGKALFGSFEFSILSYITYLAYVKFHRRFSEHVVMGICVNYKKNHLTKQPS